MTKKRKCRKFCIFTKSIGFFFIISRKDVHSILFTSYLMCFRISSPSGKIRMASRKGKDDVAFLSMSAVGKFCNQRMSLRHKRLHVDND